MYKKQEQEDRCCIHLDGELTIYNVAELKTHFMDVLDDSRDLDIDLGNITKIDSAGVQLLIWIKKERQRLNKIMTLSNHGPEVLEVFELFGLVSLFNDPIVLTGKSEVKNGRL